MTNAIKGEFAIIVMLTACLASLLACSRDRTGREQRPGTVRSTSDMDDTSLDFPQYEEWPFDDAEAKRRQQETASRLGVSVEQQLKLADGVHLNLVLIPTGRFVMGFEGSDGNEPHDAAISEPFYVGKLEMTWRQYMVFRQDAHLTNLRLDRILKQERNRLDHPIQGISWKTCNEYCEAASKALGCTIRLPSEAEWEYACRAGTTKRFIWDDVLRVGDANASCLEHIDGKLRPVQRGGQCRANAFGLYDMIGNVGEWVHDKYKEDEYTGTVRDSSRGHKGLAARKPQPRKTSGPYDGFRVVVEIDQKLLTLLKNPKPVQPSREGGS